MSILQMHAKRKIKICYICMAITLLMGVLPQAYLQLNFLEGYKGVRFELDR